MVCLSAAEFDKLMSQIEESEKYTEIANKRIALLEETLRNTENELKQERLMNTPNAKQANPDKYPSHLPHQVRGWTPEDS
jgi:hypothetical protein